MGTRVLSCSAGTARSPALMVRGRGQFRSGLSGCAHRFDDRIDVLRVKGRRAQKFNERRPQQSRAVVNQVRLLTPSGEVEIVPSAVVGKRKAVKVQLSHQQTCNTRQHKRPAAESQEALSKARAITRPNPMAPHHTACNF